MLTELQERELHEMTHMHAEMKSMRQQLDALQTARTSMDAAIALDLEQPPPCGSGPGLCVGDVVIGRAASGNVLQNRTYEVVEVRRVGTKEQIAIHIPEASTRSGWLVASHFKLVPVASSRLCAFYGVKALIDPGSASFELIRALDTRTFAIHRLKLLLEIMTHARPLPVETHSCVGVMCELRSTPRPWVLEDERARVDPCSILSLQDYASKTIPYLYAGVMHMDVLRVWAAWIDDGHYSTVELSHKHIDALVHVLTQTQHEL